MNNQQESDVYMRVPRQVLDVSNAGPHSPRNWHVQSFLDLQGFSICCSNFHGVAPTPRILNLHHLHLRIRKRSIMKNQIPWSTVGMVVAWYGSNIGVLLLNKYLLSNYGFKYPVFLTLCHMTACSLLSYVAIVCMKVVPVQTIKSGAQLLKIAGLSVVFCFSVVCGNVSLRYLPVSFNQAIGATTPLFTAVFAYVMSSKKEAWVTYLTLLPVVAGVIIASGVNKSSFFLLCNIRSKSSS